MAEINEYFPSVKIRTLQSDLKSLKESGGTLTPEKEIKIAKEDYLSQEKPKEAVIAPPVLEIRSTIPAMTPNQQKIGSFEQSLQNRPAKVADKITPDQDAINPKLLWWLGGGLIFIVGSSIAFWLIYPNLKLKIAVAPTPTPSPIVTPTPSPSPIAPILALKIKAEKSPLILSSLDANELSQKLKLETLQPRPTGTLVFFEVQQNTGEYLDGTNLIKIISPNALTSFKSSINSDYLLLGNWETENSATLGLILTIKPEAVETVRSIIKSWETANMEEYFPIIYLPQNPEKRKTETFKTVKISNVEAREISINQQKFIYALLADKLIIAPTEKSFELILKNL